MTLRGTKIAMFLAAVAALLTAVVAAPAAAEPKGRVVVIGVPGLTWSDVDQAATPALWALTAKGAGANLSVRTTRAGTCPTDGWLTLSAGQRARLAHGECALPSAPVLPGGPSPAGAVPAGGAAAAGWPAIKTDNAATSYHARVGLLGDAVRAAGGCTTAVGPGAVFGAADGSGRVDRYIASPDKASADDWRRCALTAVDVDDVFRAYMTAGVDARGDQVPVGARERAAAVAAADRRIAQVVAGVPAGTTVLVAGLSDTGVNPHLRLAVALGGGYGTGLLRSSATRHDGLVTLTDATATVLEVLGLPQPKEAVGSAWTRVPSDAGAADRVERLADGDVAAQAMRRVQTSFYWVLFATQLVLYGVAMLALRRLGRDPGARARILGGTRVIALIGGAVPCGSFLAGLVPWWRAPTPTIMLVCLVLGWAGLLTGVALSGPWRRSAFAPGLVITGATALVLAVDVMTGSTLQLNSLMGYTALVAGRFYGFGNQAFALFAVAAVLTAAWLAEFPLRADGPRGAPSRRAALTAVGIVAVIGVAAVAVDGLPAWGSDFGGVLAMVPAFAVLGLLLTGRRVSPLKLGLFCLAGAAIVLLISYLNARSANPTHLGRFWQDLVAGDAWDVVARKFDAMLNSLGYWPFTLPLAAAIGFLFFMLARPTRYRASLLDRAYAHSRTMRPALIGALAVGVIGTLVNDSGLVIMSVAFSLAIPLMLAAGVRSLELDLAAGTEPSAPPAARSASTGSPSA
ncbi:hypothetical protein [Spirillospora albida]|uniref:hypothetical protein n=1 Tax=Spirillospora albida TaxID=58123 RepID=UPI00055D8B63|nr:hypothetical protein [Spirillospora albida]